jgi:uroporphyrinogen-III synthase
MGRRALDTAHAACNGFETLPPDLVCQLLSLLPSKQDQSSLALVSKATARALREHRTSYTVPVAGQAALAEALPALQKLGSLHALRLLSTAAQPLHLSLRSLDSKLPQVTALPAPVGV